jgi:hypothetical protein
LIISKEVFQESLIPYNETEFIGGDIIRAARFVSDEMGHIIKVVVLPGLISDKEIIELEKE